MKPLPPAYRYLLVRLSEEEHAALVREVERNREKGDPATYAHVFRQMFHKLMTKREVYRG